jgi:type IV pilus assembly protein PilA
MAEKGELLAQTKPLADPLRVIAILMVIGAALNVAAGLVTNAIWPALAAACWLLGLALLMSPSGKPNAIYLRAFRTDKSTAALRSELAAILGPDFRLSGIRPPREKTSVFMRFLTPGLVGLRYAGSKFMELEAGDDWMARLWKTYQTTRLVFIDIRDVTPYVHQEIEMTLDAVGTSRCIFLVGPDKTEAEWRQVLAEIVGPEADPKQLQLLDVSPERVSSHQIDSDLTDIVKRLPPGVSGELEQGKQFILDHVSEEILQASRRPSVMTVLSAVAAVVLSVSFGAMRIFLPINVVLVVAISSAAVMLVAVINSISRAVKRAGRLRRAGHNRAAVRAWSVIIVAILLFFGNPVFNFANAVKPIEGLKKEANETAAIQMLHTLNMAELMYESTYPSVGYACTLSALGGRPDSGDPKPESAQLIENDVSSSGMKSGYTFTISNCAKAKVKGKDVNVSYQITAVPTSPGQTGARGFCTDENAEIRFDPNGGTNCTEHQ